MKNPFRKISKRIEKIEKDTFDEKKIKSLKEKIKKIQNSEFDRSSENNRAAITTENPL